MLQNIHLRLPKVYRRDILDFKEFIEINVDAIFLLQVPIRRFFDIRGRILRNQDCLYFK